MALRVGPRRNITHASQCNTATYHQAPALVTCSSPAEHIHIAISVCQNETRCETSSEVEVADKDEHPCPHCCHLVCPIVSLNNGDSTPRPVAHPQGTSALQSLSAPADKDCSKGWDKMQKQRSRSSVSQLRLAVIGCPLQTWACTSEAVTEGSGLRTILSLLHQ